MTSSSTRSQISSLTLCPVGFSFAYYAFSAYCHIIKEMSAIARLITLWVWLWVCLTHIHIDFSTTARTRQKLKLNTVDLDELLTT